MPLIIIAFLGYKYVKNSDVFLSKKDINKAKQKIKDARNSALVSKELRRKANSEVMRIRAKSSVRTKNITKSQDIVEDLKVINNTIESSQDSRNKTAGDLLKRRKKDD